MRKISTQLRFEWDESNANKNWHKHQVDAKEAEEIFFNQPFISVEDKKHSQRELRFQGLGKTNNDRKLFISYTMRNNKIRVISVRDMNKKEKNIYEKI